MFKMFVAGALSFLSAIFLTRVNDTLEWPNLWFALLCALVSFFVAKFWFKVFKIETDLVGKPNKSGEQKTITASNFFGLFSAACGFIFSLLG